MDQNEIEKIIKEMHEDFDAIQMPRTPFMLKSMVVDAHCHPAQAWAQCVLEMQIKFDNIRRADIQRKILLIEIERLEKHAKEKNDEISQLRADKKRIDIEQQDRAMLGAKREFEALYKIYKSFPQRFTREELNDAQPEYWRQRITNQAERDMLATGHVSQGNQEALSQIGVTMQLPEIAKVNERIAEIEHNYIASGNRRLLIIVPTKKKAENGLPCLENIKFPAGVEIKVHNIYGLPVADAYNEAALMAVRENTDWLFTVEDDTFPPGDALIKLIEHDFDIVGAWYPKREEPRTGVPIIIKNGHRQGLNDPDGLMYEVYTIPNGCTLIKTSVFRQLQFPFFVTTPQLSQDSFFSQLARESGLKLWCDTSILCRHVDRVTGEEYT